MGHTPPFHPSIEGGASRVSTGFQVFIGLGVVGIAYQVSEKPGTAQESSSGS